MRRHLGLAGVMAGAVLLTFTSVPGAVENPSLVAESDKGTIKSESSQEQQDKQRQMQDQNLQERQRLQPQSMKEGVQAQSSKENAPIGGQKQGGPADFPQPAFPWVKGELMQIEGNFYVLKDAEGKEVRVHVDKGTKMQGAFNVGDILEVNRTLPGHAVEIRKSATALSMPSSSTSAGAGPGSSERIVKDEQVSLGGAKQAVRGEVLRIEGENNYVIKDGHGNEVRLAVNQNTRMFCGSETGSSLLPAPSASDKPGAKGQPQDLAKTAEQQGSEVGPGTKGAQQQAATNQCKFKPGEMIEAEISDMGAATFIKQAGRAQPGQPLP
jgi:hypothetical protein